MSLADKIIQLVQFYFTKECNVITVDVLEDDDTFSVCIGSDCVAMTREELPVVNDELNGISVDYKLDEDLGNSLMLTFSNEKDQKLKQDDIIELFSAIVKEKVSCMINIFRQKNKQQYSVSNKGVIAAYTELNSQQLDEQLRKHFTALEERLK